MKKIPISREEAISKLKEMPGQTEQLMGHYIESEAIMRGLARHFREDEEYWGMLGLLHDVDTAYTKDNLSEHCLKARDILSGWGFDSEFIETIQSHVYGLDIVPAFKDKTRDKMIEYALVAAETISGMIYAYALMRGKRISDMKVKGLKKKFKDKTFAAGCDRELIREIEKTGLELSEFFEIAISSMKEIKDDIGLE